MEFGPGETAYGELCVILVSLFIKVYSVIGESTEMFLVPEPQEMR